MEKRNRFLLLLIILLLVGINVSYVSADCSCRSSDWCGNHLVKSNLCDGGSCKHWPSYCSDNKIYERTKGCCPDECPWGINIGEACDDETYECYECDSDEHCNDAGDACEAFSCPTCQEASEHECVNVADGSQPSDCTTSGGIYRECQSGSCTECVQGTNTGASKGSRSCCSDSYERDGKCYTTDDADNNSALCTDMLGSIAWQNMDDTNKCCGDDPTRIKIRAKSSCDAPQTSHMELRINDEVIQGWDVGTATIIYGSGVVNLIPNDAVDVAFTNDGSGGACADRNLYVDYIQIGNEIFYAGTDDVTYYVGSSAYNDRKWMPWNGYQRAIASGNIFLSGPGLDYGYIDSTGQYLCTYEDGSWQWLDATLPGQAFQIHTIDPEVEEVNEIDSRSNLFDKVVNYLGNIFN